MRHRSFRRDLTMNTFIRIVSFSALVGAPLALGAQEIIELEKFVVTSQKRTQEIKDVPIAVTAYNGEFLNRLGVGSFKDLAPYVPGLFIQEQSPNNPGINVRGVTTDSGDPRQETRVSIFQDGVSISRSRGSVSELFDMERVEVLKGPQGTLFGRGAQIGALSLIQNKARNENSGQLTAGFGNNGKIEAAGTYNAVLAPNTLFGRVAFSYVDREGSIENVADGSDLNGKNTLGIRTSLRWQPTPATTADFILNYQRDQPPGTAFKSGTFAPRGGDTRPFNTAELNRGSELGIDRTVVGLTAIVTHDLNDAFTLTSISGYRDFDSFEAFDADGTRLAILEFAEDYQGEQLSQELRISYDTGGRFTGFAGLSYFDEEGSARVPFYTDERQLAAFLLRNNGVPVFNADGRPYTNLTTNPLTGGTLRPYNREEYTQYGATVAYDLFADGTYDLTDRLELSAGLRATFEDVTSGYRVVNALTPAGFPTGAANFPNTLFAPTNGLIEANRDYQAWVARLVARYKISDNISAFASAARGRRPDTLLISFVGGRYIPVELNEEIVWNYELGIKGSVLNNRFNWSASVYRYDYQNFQSTAVNPNPPPLTVTVDAGNATGEGFEFAFQSVLSRQFTAFASFGYTDATFDDVNDAGQRQQLAGNTFRLTSRQTSALGFTYTAAMGEAGQFQLTPSYQYKSKHYFDDNNANAGGILSQDGYGLLSLRATYVPAGDRWAITAYVDNLLDKEYIIDAGNTGGAFGIPTFIAGDPRLYGVRATYRF
jgi:outer membrane receptor protein involved in Fe transport